MTDLDFKEIGLKIKERRKAVGVTQEHIANELEVNTSHISNIECGRDNPSLTALVKIANILECSVDFFISGEYTYKIIKVLKMIDLLWPIIDEYGKVALKQGAKPGNRPFGLAFFLI